MVEFNDYVPPNVALADKAKDANYFQHQPYLDVQVAQRGYQFTVVAPIHLEPLGLCCGKAKPLASLGNGGTIAIPNGPVERRTDPQTLAANQLVTLKDIGGRAPTVQDVAANPRGLRFSELGAAQLPRSLGDVDAAVINGNHAIPGGLDPATGALTLESSADNPHANLLVARRDNASAPRLKRLAELLCSDRTKQFIKNRYKGAVVSACPGSPA